MTRLLYTLVPMCGLALAACPQASEAEVQAQALIEADHQQILRLTGPDTLVFTGDDGFSDGPGTKTLSQILRCGDQSTLTCYDDGTCQVACAKDLWQ